MKPQTTASLTEDDIRPADLMQGQSIAMTIDIGRLLINADKFVHVNCPACDSSIFSSKYTKYGMNFVECTSCATMFTNPRPTDTLLEEFYKHSVNYEYWNNHIFPSSEKARREQIFVPRVNQTIEFCEKYGIARESLLEVGAAFGTFCAEMKERNFFKKIIAVEPTPSLAQTLREKGIDVIEEVIERIYFEEEGKFDVVVNFEVIEHIFSPRDFLKNCRKLLKVGGLFIVTCPNGQGFDFQILGEKCNSLDHEHLNYFNTQSLPLLLEDTGFEILEVLTPGKLDAELVRKKIISGDIDVSNQPFLKQVLVDEWESLGSDFQNFLSENNLSSNLWVVAKAK